jgi:hypothetical protein
MYKEIPSVSHEFDIKIRTTNVMKKRLNHPNTFLEEVVLSKYIFWKGFCYPNIFSGRRSIIQINFLGEVLESKEIL